MLALLLLLSTTTCALAEEKHEPIQFFERYKPSFFLLGKPITKVQISFKVQAFREIPIYFGYSQLMMWDLFRESAPFRDINFNPDIFYRLPLGNDPDSSRSIDFAPFEHESNGKAGAESRSWNNVYVRYLSNKINPSHGRWWSLKLMLPYNLEDSPSKRLPKRRGIWELQFGFNNLLPDFFEVSELILRIYGGGESRINPVYGGQELTVREKVSRRSFLLPLYFQVFHGYGENLLDADENRWGLRAGIGF
jgi:phospholipase A1/A2